MQTTENQKLIEELRTTAEKLDFGIMLMKRMLQEMDEEKKLKEKIKEYR